MMGSDTQIDENKLADLADLVLSIAQQLEFRGPAARNIIPLTNAEVTVVREVHRSPGITATGTAKVTGFQRSNVSAAARKLEHAGLLQQVGPREGDRGVGFAPTVLADESFAVLRQHWAERLALAPPESLSAVVAELPALERIMRALTAA